METRRKFLAMMIMGCASAACTAPSVTVTQPEETATAVKVYSGPLPAAGIDPQPRPLPCPGCAYTTSDTIRGRIKDSVDFPAGLFPLQWMKAVYKDNGVVQGVEVIDIDDGSNGTDFEHPVGVTTFDEIYLEWLDAEDTQGITDESIPFET